MDKNQQEPQQSQPKKQKQQQEIIKEEDFWIYESLLQYLQSPVYKAPLYDFFEQNCVSFESTKNLGSQQQQIHQSYKEFVDNLIYILSQDIEVDSVKIFEMAQTGLNVQQHAKYFWTFRIYYHFNDFVRFMVKKNVDLEKQAMSELTQSQQVINRQNQDGGQQHGLSQNEYQQQLQLQQQYEKNKQIQQDKEYEKAIKDSLALEQLRNQQQDGNQNEDDQMKQLEAVMALSKIEHEEQQKKGQMTEEEELEKILALSKLESKKEQQQQLDMIQQQQSKINYNNNNNNESIGVQQQQKNVQQQQQQQEEEPQKDNLMDFSDEDEDLELIQPEQSQQEFDDQVFKERQGLLGGLQNMDTTSFVQQEQQQQQEQEVVQQQQEVKQETLEEKKERLKKQRELLLQRKKQQREQVVEDYNNKEPAQKNESIDPKVSEQRTQLYQKINQNLQQQ